MFYPFRFHSNYFRFRVFKTRKNFFWVFLESLADEYFTTDNWLTTIWLSPPYPSSRTSKNSTPCSSSFLTVTLSTDCTKPKKSQIEFPNLASSKYRKSFFESLAIGNGNRVSLIENEFWYLVGNIEKLESFQLDGF